MRHAEDLAEGPDGHHCQPVGLDALGVEVEVRRPGVRLVLGTVGREAPTQSDERGHLLVVELVCLGEVGVARELAPHQVLTPGAELDVRRSSLVLVADRRLRLDEDQVVVLHRRDVVGQPAPEGAPVQRRTPVELDSANSLMASPVLSTPHQQRQGIGEHRHFR